MKRITMVIAGLGGRGHDIYGNYAMEHPDEVEIAAVADPRPERLELAQREWNIPAERCFATAEELFAQPQLADAAVIATQDRQHVVHAEAALKGGYHLLLEKPVAVDIEGCLEVLRLARRYQRHVVVCHVLRYTPFYNAIKRIIEDGRIGEVVTIQAMEQVGYWHQAHSFVRGNWRNSNTTSPMILQKCCHDMDLLLWLTGKTCESVSSFGDTYLFKPQCAPEGAALRCLDGCKAKDHCPFDAEKIYLKDPKIGVENGYTQWPVNVLTLHPTVESVTQAIQNGPYGRCVYHCDNNVVDHQVVNLKMTDGSTISHTMCAFTATGSRYAKFMGTMGEIIADMTANTIQITPFGKDTETIDINQIASDFFGHGGGDKRMVEDFIDMLLLGNGPSGHTTTVEQSVESHYCAFAAEESRLHNGAVVELDKFRK